MRNGLSANSKLQSEKKKLLETPAVSFEQDSRDYIGLSYGTGIIVQSLTLIVIHLAFNLRRAQAGKLRGAPLTNKVR